MSRNTIFESSQDDELFFTQDLETNETSSSEVIKVSPSGSNEVSSSQSTQTNKYQMIRKKHVLNLFNKQLVDNEEELQSSNTHFHNNNSNSVVDSTVLNDSKKIMSVATDNDIVAFNVVYGKKTAKKHKTWEGDGILEVVEKNVVLKDLEGKIIGRSSVKSETVTEGFSLSIGNYLVEVLEKITSYNKNASKPSAVCTEILEPPTKKFKKFVPLKPSASKGPNMRYNQLLIMKEKMAAYTPPMRSNEKILSKPKEKVTKVLNLFNKKSENEIKNESVDVEMTDSTQTSINDENVKTGDLQKIIFNVVYGKITAKKHKTYDEDGTLEVDDKSAILKDIKNNIIGRTAIKPGSIFEGAKVFVAGKEVEVLEKILESKNTTKPESTTKPTLAASFKLAKKGVNLPFTSLHNTGKLTTYEPLIMPNINQEIDWDGDDKKIHEVSVDACLATVLRPHQRAGIIFLYKCIMGINKQEYAGAILADEMGLGKTLQCISLIWTLLKQGPFGKPVLKRALIVAPSSLCSNWKKEFIRWLGSHRVSPYVVNEKNKPKDFTKNPRATVMIISYEMFVRKFDDVNKHNFDIVICDEGHRLKNSDVKAVKMLNQLNTRRRILLTGTPVQNDLQELYTLADFVNPGVFEDRLTFKKYYENPIVASQAPEASEEVIELGLERAKELHECTKLFTLRRTNDLINKYLPQKHELVIFCKCTEVQGLIYETIANDWLNRTEFPNNKIAFPFTVINNLKKICNHPGLLKNDKNEFKENSTVQGILGKLNSMDICDQSGKLKVVRAVLKSLKDTTEKLVIVSYFTQTLDILEKVCGKENFQFCRLDGNTSTSSRMQIVEKFNSNINKDCRIFLLSAKAGGVGLNLPAASRLILFDSDWNPANDAQAMARIWREGQKRTVYIYRLLTTGTIEEKIYQRQISKTGLSEAVVDSNHFSSMKLSMSELKDLFTLVQNSNSVTHDLMECSCEIEFDNSNDEENLAKESEEDVRNCQLNLQNEDESSKHITMNQLLHWKHYKPPIDEQLLKDLLMQQVGEQITFIFKNSSQPSQPEK